MSFFDAHSHINAIFKEFYSDFLNFSSSKGVSSIFINSEISDGEDFSSLINSPPAEKSTFPDILLFRALHPWNTESVEIWEKSEKKTLENLLKKNKKILIGETGLDRLRGADIETQKEIFRSHIELAVKYKRPFTIHCVREWGNCLNILKSGFQGRTRIPFIIHSFTGSHETMNELIKMGGYISFSAAMIIRRNSKTLENIAKADSSRMLIETDFPFSAVDSHGKMKLFKDGTEAGSFYIGMLEKAYKTAADILNISIGELGRITEKNGKIFTDYTTSGQ